MRLVLVTWIDAHFDLDESPRPITAHTVGWIIEDSDDCVTVAGERFENGAFRGFTAIPRGCVVTVQEIAWVA